ncbi:MAG: carbohydrate-binding protein [Clostridia bacterium]|nr:carbohydrate-binding protein [Clostridia bacterium]
MFWLRRFGAENDAEFASELTPSGVGSSGKTTRSTGAKKTARKNTGENSFLAGGVAVSPMPVTAGERITVKYNGLLAQSGADSVYLHAGFGAREWRNVADVPMTQEKPGTWKAALSLDPNENSRLNFCFKDRAENWDNNYGLNWSLEVHNGQM